MGDALADPGPEGGGEDAPCGKAEDDAPVIETDAEQKAKGSREGDEELDSVHAANGLTERISPGEQGGADDRAPAASANGIDKSTEEGEGPDVGGDGLRREGAHGLHDEDEAHEQQVACDPGLDGISGDLGEQVGSDKGT